MGAVNVKFHLYTAMKKIHELCRIYRTPEDMVLFINAYNYKILNRVITAGSFTVFDDEMIFKAPTISECLTEHSEILTFYNSYKSNDGRCKCQITDTYDMITHRWKHKEEDEVICKRYISPKNSFFRTSIFI